MIALLCFLALVAFHAIAAPATNSSQTPFFVSTIWTGLSSLSSSTDITSAHITSSNNPPSTIPVTSLPSVVSSHPSSSAAPFTSRLTSILLTKVVTAFETTTVHATPSFVTRVLTETATTTAIPTTTPITSWDTRTLWAAPPRMTDLSGFNITHFPSGQRNLGIVSEIPADAISPTAKDRLLSFNATPLTFLQLVYPAHSVNPGSKPAGGADFYATPLNLAGAQNVTLEYSVFFPADFDWVKGGKLPGLFGGHTGCSGGASADDCFSTRLMWRQQGVGELYLYAPKDKQSDALCADAKSVCDVAYGFSIGRGAFNFTAGDWTHLSQNVVLNTPGRNDGTFTLMADGQLAIDRKDMFYRDVARSSGNQPAEFLGLFFSTFFGGNGKQYATPRQQYTWFRDFAITRYD